MPALPPLLALPVLLALAGSGCSRGAGEAHAATPPLPAADPAPATSAAELAPPPAPRAFVPAEPEGEPSPEEIAAIERPSILK